MKEKRRSITRTHLDLSNFRYQIYCAFYTLNYRGFFYFIIILKTLLYPVCRLAECLSLAREYRRLWQFISIYFFAEYCVNLVFPTQRSRPGANRRNNIIDFFFFDFLLLVR